MTQFPTRRLAAATVLALALTVFALPAAAAPAGAWSVSSWELPTILSWFDAVWTGWFGGEEVQQPTEITSIHGQQAHASEPDGQPLRMLSTTPSGGAGIGSDYTGESW
jgi:hypothetical protein